MKEGIIMTKVEFIKKEMNENGISDLSQYFKVLGAKEIRMFYSGWECDTKGWLYKDTLFSTSHGSLIEMSKEEIKEYVNDIDENLNELKKLINKK